MFNLRRAAAIAAAAACLAATGCSAIKSMAATQAPQPATGATSAGPSGAGLNLGNAPGASTFASGDASVAASVVPPNPLGPPADPFAGTPADHWADGAAGIAAPAAAPIGPYTKTQVEYAYQTMRQLLIAGNLDKQTLLGGAPTAFADLLIPSQKSWFLDGLGKKGVDKQGDSLDTRQWVMSFEPGSTQFIGSMIKVHGSMRGKAVKEKDGSYEFDVVVDYLFVYPIEPPHQPDDWMRIVSEVAWTVGFSNWQGAPSSFAPWLESNGASAGVSGTDCGETDGYSHPDYPVTVTTTPGAQPSVSPSGTPVNPYVAGKSYKDTCQATTGT